jgi:hypothetical protein
MGQTVSVLVSAEDHARLAAIIGDRSLPLKHVQRAQIVLYSADRLPALEVARRAEPQNKHTGASQQGRSSAMS